MASQDHIEELTNRDYQYGFVTDVESDRIPKGLNEDIVRLTPEELRAKMAAKEANEAMTRGA